jgi:hypothetical protein
MTDGNPFADELAEMTLAWSDRWYDDAVGLLWNPPGSFGGAVADQSVHLVPQSAWYAAGLLRRDGDGDRARAVAVIESLLALQYDREGTVWHGTFARFAEWSEPGAAAVEWDDYDPNWRQFIGTTWLVILREFEERLPNGTVERIDRSLRLCVEGEPPERVAVWYTNIALMRAVIEVESGHRLHEPAWVDRGHALAAAVVERRERKGTFDEFNSPTYYGIDLLGLAMWRSCAVSSRLREWGAVMESALWAETALLYHAGLGNLCGPYTRSYGMDLHRYVGALALWMWPVIGRQATPLPALDAPAIDHGHDLCLGSMVALLGSVIPAGVQPWLQRFPGPSRLERLVSERPQRIVTAWLGEHVMVGAEDNHPGWPASHQFFPATIHWAGAAGDVGGLRLVHNGSVRARATEGELAIDCGPAVDGSGPAFLVEVDGFEPTTVAADRWALPGLDVAVESDLHLAEVVPFGSAHLLGYSAPGDGPASIVLRLRSRSGAAGGE